MKKILPLALALALFSCSKSDDSGDSNSSSFSFKNQNVQGKIEGADFTGQAGSASISTFDSDTTYFIEIFGDTTSDPCGVFGFTSDKVMMHVPREVGLYELSLSTTGTSRTVTLFDADEVTNVISTEGAIEILEITDSKVKGRIDARFDSDNNVNGNFEVDRCN